MTKESTKKDNNNGVSGGNKNKGKKRIHNELSKDNSRAKASRKCLKKISIHIVGLFKEIDSKITISKPHIPYIIISDTCNFQNFMKKRMDNILVNFTRLKYDKKKEKNKSNIEFLLNNKDENKKK